MRRDLLETVLGAVVLLVAGFFLMFAYSSADIRSVEGYELVAQFNDVGGLQPGSDVRIGGVKVGSVAGQSLDPKSFLAVVRLSVDPSVKLPIDTVAVISSESLLGGKYLALQPGGEEQVLTPGGRIQYTQSTPGFEQLLGQVIYSLQNVGKTDASKNEGAGNPPAAPANR